MFVTAGLYFAVRIFQDGAWHDYAGFGAVLGLAVASKISIAPLAVLAVLAAGGRVLEAEKQDTSVRMNFFGLSLAAVLSVFIFRIFQPYAFEGPHIWNVLPNPAWIANISEIAALANMGSMLRLLGQTERATEVILAALDIAEKCNIASFDAVTKRSLALLYEDRGEYDEAVAILDELQGTELGEWVEQEKIASDLNRIQAKIQGTWDISTSDDEDGLQDFGPICYAMVDGDQSSAESVLADMFLVYGATVIVVDDYKRGHVPEALSRFMEKYGDEYEQVLTSGDSIETYLVRKL